jgi:hypothetical protein
MPNKKKCCKDVSGLPCNPMAMEDQCCGADLICKGTGTCVPPPQDAHLCMRARRSRLLLQG